MRTLVFVFSSLFESLRLFVFFYCQLIPAIVVRVLMSLVHTDAIVINGQQVYTVRLILMNAKTRASVASS